MKHLWHTMRLHRHMKFVCILSHCRRGRKVIIPSLYIARIEQLLPGTPKMIAVTDPSELPVEWTALTI